MLDALKDAATAPQPSTSQASGASASRYYYLGVGCLLALVLLTLAFLLPGLGIFAAPTQRFLGFFSLALSLLLMQGWGARLRFSWLVLGAAWWLAMQLDQGYLWALCALLVYSCASMELAATSLGRWLNAVALTTAFAALGYLLLAQVPATWRPWFEASLALSSFFAGLGGSPQILGPSASGLGLVWIFSCLCLSVGLLCRNLNDRLLALVVWFIGLVVYGFFLAVVVLNWSNWLLHGLTDLNPAWGYAFSRFNPASIAFHAPWLLVLLLSATAAILLSVRGLPSTAAKPMDKSFFSKRAGLISLALGLFGAWVITPFYPATPTPGTRVVLHNEGMLDWRVPTHGSYGLQQVGMFGLFPRYLQAAGYHIERLSKTQDIDLSQLGADAVLVITNPTEAFNQAELEAIWQHVESGGGLLVLGDHTDLGGMMAPLNDLLAPMNIAYRFDSAFSLRRWQSDYEIFPHPVTRRLDWSNSRLQQSTGASLALGEGAYPLVSGKLAFSDAGVATNEANGYLGDYRYQLDEILGDVVVVAGANYGQGRVLVFGDTSAFQNVAIYHAAPFIVDAMDYLAGAANHQTPQSLSAAWPQPLWVLAVVALLLGWWALQGWQAKRLATLSLSLLVAVLLLRQWDAAPLRFAHAKLALLEASQMNQFSLAHWQRDSLGGLLTNLSRAGFLPLIMREEDWDYLPDAQLLVSVAPALAYSDEQEAQLQSFMEQGGNYVLAMGWEESVAMRDFLARRDFVLGSAPLGPVPVRLKTNDPLIIQTLRRQPQFHEAWAISGDQPFDEVLYEDLGYVIAAARNQGAGRMTLIADSYFLMDRALEEENAWWPGNVQFVQQLLAGMGRQEVSQ